MTKVLLLTDIPPCTDYTGGLVIKQLCGFLPPGSIVCCAVLTRSIKARMSPDLDWIPVRYYRKPTEEGFRLLPGTFGEITARWMEKRNERIVSRKLLPSVVNFARGHGVDKVWCILEGQTMVRLARPVAKSLGVPLYTQVWDTLGWWLRAKNIDHRTRTALLTEFDEVIRASRGCATASWAMAEEYERKYGVKAVSIISSLDRKEIRSPAKGPNDSNDFVIGFAGQIYAIQEWNAFIQALESANWQVGDRRVVFRILCRQIPDEASRPRHAEYLGWRSQSDAITALSQADVLYLPYWFSNELRDEVVLSFPSKLITYMAAGRPVLFHGPRYASPAVYLEKCQAGVRCHSLDPAEIYSLIQKLATDAELYSTAAKNGHLAVTRDFTYETMKAEFLRLLEMPSHENCVGCVPV